MKNNHIETGLSRRQWVGLAAGGLATGLLPFAGWADSGATTLRSIKGRNAAMALGFNLKSTVTTNPLIGTNFLA